MKPAEPEKPKQDVPDIVVSFSVYSSKCNLKLGADKFNRRAERVINEISTQV